jgi:hypothetical protein
VDRRQISAAAYLSASPSFSSTEVALDRLGAYWRALGVVDPAQIAALSQQALRRLPELPETPGIDPVGRAIIAAGDLLDDWLAQALELPKPSPMLAAARATLLSGIAPDWPAALFAPPGTTSVLLDALRAALAESTPSPSAGVMPAQRIELFSLFSLFSPLRRLWRRNHPSASGISPP